MSTYRTDNGGGLGQPNASITRPFNIAKFSEFYFIAAEAAVKGATTTAGNTAKDLLMLFVHVQECGSLTGPKMLQKLRIIALP